jgi:hypothetical protein
LIVVSRFAERGEQGGFQQQDANECWMELLKMLQQKTKVSTIFPCIYLWYLLFSSVVELEPRA